MIKFLAERRFNRVDVVGLSVAASLITHGMYISCLIVIVIGVMGSHWIENISQRTP